MRMLLAERGKEVISGNIHLKVANDGNNVPLDRESNGKRKKILNIYSLT